MNVYTHQVHSFVDSTRKLDLYTWIKANPDLVAGFYPGDDPSQFALSRLSADGTEPATAQGYSSYCTADQAVALVAAKQLLPPGWRDKVEIEAWELTDQNRPSFDEWLVAFGVQRIIEEA